MKLYSAACERNQTYIADILVERFCTPGTILEVASGTGMHAVYFAQRMPHVHWQPTDIGPDALLSIEAWRHEARTENLLAPVRLDVSEIPWNIDSLPTPIVGIFNANMIHISPWTATVGLFRGAGRHLHSGGELITYGPYRFNGRMAESNMRFDESLKTRDPAWGVRDFEAIVDLALAEHLTCVECHALPANNHCLVFRRR